MISQVQEFTTASFYHSKLLQLQAFTNVKFYYWNAANFCCSKFVKLLCFLLLFLSLLYILNFLYKYFFNFTAVKHMHTCLGTPQKLLMLSGYSEVPPVQLVFILAVCESGWSLLTNGCCSEVVVVHKCSLFRGGH